MCPILAVLLLAVPASAAKPPAGWVLFETDAGDGSVPYAAREEDYLRAAVGEAGTTRLPLFELRRPLGNTVVAAPSALELKVIRLRDRVGGALLVAHAACPSGEVCSGKDSGGTLDMPLGLCESPDGCLRAYGMFAGKDVEFIVEPPGPCAQAAVTGAFAQLGAAAATGGAVKGASRPEEASAVADFSGGRCPEPPGRSAAEEPRLQPEPDGAPILPASGFHSAAVPPPSAKKTASSVPGTSKALPLLAGAVGGALLGLLLGGPLGALIGAVAGAALGAGWGRVVD